VPGAEATVGKQRKWRHNFQKIPQDDTEQWTTSVTWKAQKQNCA
jgi:hypothetical protein